MSSSTSPRLRFTSLLCALLALAGGVGHADAGAQTRSPVPGPRASASLQIGVRVVRAATVSLGAGFDTALVTTSSGPVPRIELSAPIELDGRWYIVRTVYF